MNIGDKYVLPEGLAIKLCKSAGQVRITKTRKYNASNRKTFEIFSVVDKSPNRMLVHINPTSFGYIRFSANQIKQLEKYKV